MSWEDSQAHKKFHKRERAKSDVSNSIFIFVLHFPFLPTNLSCKMAASAHCRNSLLRSLRRLSTASLGENSLSSPASIRGRCYSTPVFIQPDRKKPVQKGSSKHASKQSFNKKSEEDTPVEGKPRSGPIDSVRNDLSRLDSQYYLLQTSLKTKSVEQALKGYDVLRNSAMLKQKDFVKLISVILSSSPTYDSRLPEIIQNMKRREVDMDGVPYDLDPSTYKRLFNHFTSTRSPKDSLALYEMMKHKNQPIYLPVYNEILMACTSKTQELALYCEKAAEVWEEMLSSEESGNSTTFIKGMQIYGILGNYERVHNIYVVARQTFGDMIEELEKEEGAPKDLKRTDLRIKIGYLSALTNIAKSAPEGSPIHQEILKLFKDLKKNREPEDYKSDLINDLYNVMIKYSKMTNNKVQLDGLWEEMLEKGVRIRASTIGKLLNAAGEANDEAELLELVRKAEKLVSKPELVKVRRAFLYCAGFSTSGPGLLSTAVAEMSKWVEAGDHETLGKSMWKGVQIVLERAVKDGDWKNAEAICQLADKMKAIMKHPEAYQAPGDQKHEDRVWSRDTVVEKFKELHPNVNISASV